MIHAAPTDKDCEDDADHGARTVLVSWSIRRPGALDGVSVLEAAGLGVVNSCVESSIPLVPSLQARLNPRNTRPSGSLSRRPSASGGRRT